MSDKKGEIPKENPAKNVSVPSLPTKQTRSEDGDNKSQVVPGSGIEYRSK